MTVEIRSIHGYTQDEDTKVYIDKRMKRLNNVKEHIADLHITLDRERNGEYKTESTIHFRWGVMGHIKVSNHDIYRALDLLFEKIEAKATKEKEKIQDH